MQFSRSSAKPSLKLTFQEWLTIHDESNERAKRGVWKSKTMTPLATVGGNSKAHFTVGDPLGDYMKDQAAMREAKRMFGATEAEALFRTTNRLMSTGNSAATGGAPATPKKPQSSSGSASTRTTSSPAASAKAAAEALEPTILQPPSIVSAAMADRRRGGGSGAQTPSSAAASAAARAAACCPTCGSASGAAVPRLAFPLRAPTPGAGATPATSMAATSQRSSSASAFSAFGACGARANAGGGRLGMQTVGSAPSLQGPRQQLNQPQPKEWIPPGFDFARGAGREGFSAPGGGSRVPTTDCASTAEHWNAYRGCRRGTTLTLG